VLAFTQAIRSALSQASGVPEADLRLEQPRDPTLGDFSFPCFQLAKALKKSPPGIAAEFAGKLASSLPDISVSAAGPYLNFRIARGALARSVIQEIEAAGPAYGHTKLGQGKTIVIDLSSPNIAKPMSVGHLRSTVIGAAIQRLHDALGYETVGINHIGDWGAQFGKLYGAAGPDADEPTRVASRPAGTLLLAELVMVALHAVAAVTVLPAALQVTAARAASAVTVAAAAYAAVWVPLGGVLAAIVAWALWRGRPWGVALSRAHAIASLPSIVLTPLAAFVLQQTGAGKRRRG